MLKSLTIKKSTIYLCQVDSITFCRTSTGCSLGQAGFQHLASHGDPGMLQIFSLSSATELNITAALQGSTEFKKS